MGARFTTANRRSWPGVFAPKTGLDLDFFQRRIAQAVQYRERRGVNPRLCRVVWSESDGLPGLIVDRYRDNLVLQTLTLAMDLRKAVIVEALKNVLGSSVQSIIERNDAPVRRAEGMEAQTGVLFGETPRTQNKRLVCN